MIFPILAGWLGPARAPMTWLLIVMNLAMFSLTERFGLTVSDHLTEITRDDYFVRTQGRIYATWLRDHAGPESALIDAIAERVNGGDFARLEMLGNLAFRDERFLTSYASIEFDGDQVAFGIWKKRVAQMLDDQRADPSFTLGVSAADPSLSRWVTYIFVHSGIYHLLGNMLFLLLFGAALELEIGGLAVLMTFVGSGIASAGIFAVMTGITSSPLVGASGAINGVMAFYCALGLTRPARYFWFLLPWRGYMGFVWLPAWLAMMLWVATDVAGFLGVLPELGGVAHAAHLGGDVAGLLVGLGLSVVRKARREDVGVAVLQPL